MPGFQSPRKRSRVALVTGTNQSTRTVFTAPHEQYIFDLNGRAFTERRPEVHSTAGTPFQRCLWSTVQGSANGCSVHLYPIDDPKPSVLIIQGHPVPLLVTESSYRLPRFFSLADAEAAGRAFIQSRMAQRVPALFTTIQQPGPPLTIVCCRNQIQLLDRGVWWCLRPSRCQSRARVSLTPRV